jgi:hypothetical protein
MSLSQVMTAMSLNEAYRASNLLAKTFCSPEMMRYLDIDLAAEPEETFYDAMVVGAEFSRVDDVSRGKKMARLELRIMGPFHDRGIVLIFDDVFSYISNDIIPTKAPDIHWVEFMGDEGHRRCRIYFTSIYRFIEVGFRDIGFRVIKFGAIRPCIDFPSS